MSEQRLHAVWKKHYATPQVVHSATKFENLTKVLPPNLPEAKKMKMQALQVIAFIEKNNVLSESERQYIMNKMSKKIAKPTQNNEKRKKNEKREKNIGSCARKSYGRYSFKTKSKARRDNSYDNLKTGEKQSNFT
jgi:hypothetical protein